MSPEIDVLNDRAWLELPEKKLHTISVACRIGRDATSNDLVVAEARVSKRHAQINFVQGGYFLDDLRSANGTRLNGKPVVRPQRLKDRDEICLAETFNLRFRCPREEPVALGVAPGSSGVTEVVPQLRTCWLLITDVKGFSDLIAQHGDEGAVKRLMAWIDDMRPLIENNGGSINRYVGDAIFAYWLSDLSSPDDVRRAVQKIEAYRAKGEAPVSFRVIVHHGAALFSRSEVGEELTGMDVNFLFRAEKISKKFNTLTMFSEAAVRTLDIAAACTLLGRSTVDGIAGDFAFYAPRADFVNAIKA